MEIDLNKSWLCVRDRAGIGGICGSWEKSLQELVFGECGAAGDFAFFKVLEE
jgi:hypothetical protein